MIVRTPKTVVGPAFLWAIFTGTAFVGIGGMSLQGAGVSDREIAILWQWAAIFAVLAFFSGIITHKFRARRGGPK